MPLHSAVKVTVALSCSIEARTINMIKIKMSQDVLVVPTLRHKGLSNDTTKDGVGGRGVVM